jgi:hypothetical protein
MKQGRESADNKAFRHGVMQDWAYKKLPSGVRPAKYEDLFTYWGGLKYGQRYLYWSEYCGLWIAHRIHCCDDKNDLYFMLEQGYIYVKI